MMYRGALDAFARISREEGLGAFYKGEQGNVRQHATQQPSSVPHVRVVMSLPPGYALGSVQRCLNV